MPGTGSTVTDSRPMLGRISRQHRPGNAERGQQIVVPVQGLQIHQHGAAGVGDVGDVQARLPAGTAGAAGQVPGDPAVHRAEQQIPAFGRRPQRRVAVQHPAQLRRRRSRWPSAIRCAPARRRGRSRPAIAVEQAAGPGVLPDDGPADRNAGVPVPDHRRLALVGHAERRPPAPASDAGIGECLRHDLPDDGPDLGGVVLHPAGPGKVLMMLPLGDRHHPALPVEQHAPGRGRALVERGDIRLGVIRSRPWPSSREIDRPALITWVTSAGPRTQPVVADPVDGALDPDHRHHITAAVADRARRCRPRPARPHRPNRPSPDRGSSASSRCSTTRSVIVRLVSAGNG